MECWLHSPVPCRRYAFVAAFAEGSHQEIGGEGAYRSQERSDEQGAQKPLPQAVVDLLQKGVAVELVPEAAIA